MRALLPHPVHHLTLLLAAGSLLIAVGSRGFGQIPRSIGPISDYGAVLDRHGRERVGELIDETRRTHGISVNILADWENPYADAASLAAILLDEWGLASQPASLLAVFIRTEGRWDHAVVGSEDLSDSALARRLTDGIADLVSHRRIEEAMVALFDLIKQTIEPIADTSVDQAEGRAPIGWITGGILLIAAVLIVAIHRRICPRCGRILRVEHSSGPPGARQAHRVYYCRSCGFRRSRP